MVPLGRDRDLRPLDHDDPLDSVLRQKLLVTFREDPLPTDCYDRPDDCRTRS